LIINFLKAHTDILNRFAPVSLKEADRVKLQDRVEQKYVFHESLLREVLTGAGEGYDVLEIAGRRVMEYETIYFDDEHFSLYYQHHFGRANRFKIRIRSYRDTSTAYYEFKRKNNHRRTIKERIPCLLEAPDALSASHFTDISGVPLKSTEEFRPVVKIWYHRITLVSKTGSERITIDAGLTYISPENGIRELPVCIAEVKQERSGISLMVSALHRLHIHPLKFSKYCYGVNLMYPEQKKNNFIPRNRRIERIIHQKPTRLWALSEN